MSNIRFEELLPEQLIAIQRKEKFVFLPIGSMEWHSYHLGMGVDALHAEAVALKLAERLGGVVFPPLYIGTESERSEESLKRLGFSGNERIKGMDFPTNTIKSCYWPPELFRQIVSVQIQLLQQMGFRKIVIINGHAAAIQKEILEQISQREASQGRKLLAVTVLFSDCGVGLGHAGLAETALMQCIRPQMVDLGKLPDKPELLYYKDYGIADSGGSDRDFYVRYDPRDAAPELGEKIIEFAVNRCRDLIEEYFGSS